MEKVNVYVVCFKDSLEVCLIRLTETQARAVRTVLDMLGIEKDVVFDIIDNRQDLITGGKNG